LRQLPNLLTIIRLFASPLIAWFLLRSRFQEALGLVLLAGLTDWFDGFTARRLQVSGNVGVILDPVADKTLLVTLFLVLGVIGLLPPWLVILVIGRDLLIVFGALVLRLTRKIRQFIPSRSGKISTFFQIVLVLAVLIHAALPNELFLWLRNIALLLSAFFTALSGLDYLRRGIQMANRQPF
jgi:cardiolipin synthase (CMP-forming)